MEGINCTLQSPDPLQRADEKADGQALKIIFFFILSSEKGDGGGLLSFYIKLNLLFITEEQQEVLDGLSVFVKQQQQVVGSDSFKQEHPGEGVGPVEQQGRSLSSTPASALITRRSGISSCFQVDVFVFYVSGSSSSS
ncbi:unnamed protein product [Pleuronectes platessa]|uniref:Uncharacterized protein n=1 Tax=Pleuronectes platessa TaxID=8262 RepID=A0A9N7U6T9_PLEPL|nr:unnamed protein product [Pleuronectes platessa]